MAAWIPPQDLKLAELARKWKAGLEDPEMGWAILYHPPASGKDLLNSDFDTAAPFTLKFDESDRGKRIFFCLRWESTTNLKGSASGIYLAVIP